MSTKLFVLYMSLIYFYIGKDFLANANKIICFIYVTYIFLHW